MAGSFALWRIKAGCRAGRASRTCGASGVSAQESLRNSSPLRTMKLLCGVTLIFTLALSYYIYMPLPATVSEPYKLMLVGATFRTATHLVRNTITPLHHGLMSERTQYRRTLFEES